MNKIKGGLSDKMTIKDIVKKHKISILQLQKQIAKGIKIEMEHTNNKKIAKEIAMDHIFEDPKYYDKLSQIETNESKIIKKIIREEVQKAQSFVNKDGKLSNFELSDYDKNAIKDLAYLEDYTSDYRNKKMVFTYFTDITVYKSKKRGSISDPEVKIEVVRLTGNFTANGFSNITPKTNKLGENMFEIKFKKWPMLFQVRENSSSYPISEDELGINMMNKAGLIYGFNQKPELASANIPEEQIYNRSNSFFITPKNIEAMEFVKLLTDLLNAVKKK